MTLLSSYLPSVALELLVLLKYLNLWISGTKVLKFEALQCLFSREPTTVLICESTGDDELVGVRACRL
jgi:hypothetical protein